MRASLLLLLLLCYQQTARAVPLVRPNAVNENNRNFSWTGPRLFILGAPKCATTSLSDLLHTHPDVCKSNFKEPQYFNHFWHMGEQFYRKRLVRNPRCVGDYLDATPDYLHSPLAPSNMLQAWGKERVADKRLVVILRDPISRQFSWYNHEIKLCVPPIRKYMASRGKKALLGREISIACSKDKHCRHLCTDVEGKTMSFRQELRVLNSFDVYVAASARHDVNLYAKGLERWLRVFRREQVLVLNFEQLVGVNSSLVEVVARHYEIKPFAPDTRLPRDNAASFDPSLQTALQCSSVRQLEQRYAEPTRELYQLLARNEPDNPRSLLEPPFGTFSRAKCVDESADAPDAAAGERALKGDEEEGEGRGEQLALIGIFSTAPSAARRAVIRSTYLQHVPPALRFTFVVCAQDRMGRDSRGALQAEHAKFRDITTLNCTENMNEGKTYDWFRYFGSSDLALQPRFVAKADEDTFVHPANLLAFLQALPRASEHEVYFGRVPKPNYPFMTGMLYGVSRDVARQIAGSQWVEQNRRGREDETFGRWMLHQGLSAANWSHLSEVQMYDDPSTSSKWTRAYTPQTIGIHRLKADSQFNDAYAFFWGKDTAKSQVE